MAWKPSVMAQRSPLIAFDTLKFVETLERALDVGCCPWRWLGRWRAPLWRAGSMWSLSSRKDRPRYLALAE